MGKMMESSQNRKQSKQISHGMRKRRTILVVTLALIVLILSFVCGDGLRYYGKTDVVQSSENKTEKRNASIIYSGGDDILLVGAWDEVISIALDIKNALSRYTQNTLSLSAGIGIYTPSYPISRIAFEVSSLEGSSKNMPNKESITIFPTGKKYWEDGVNFSEGTYYWDEFENKVISLDFNVQ